MTARHYDVVVLGRSLGALTTAALLARREFRVLLLGQGGKPPSYRFGPYRLKRHAFTLLCAQSPIWRKVLRDLAQSQSFNRKVVALDPMFTLLSQGRRLEVSPDVGAFSKEVEREFPEVRQVIDEFNARLGTINAALDTAFDREISWPPGTLFERWATGRAIAGIPIAGGETAADLLGKFPPTHPYRDVALLPARFASDLAEGANPTALSLARLHGSWIRGLFALPEGQDDLENFLLERIGAHGGECRLSSSATAISVHHGRVTGIWEGGAEEHVGTSAIVSSSPGASLLAMANLKGVSPTASQRWPTLSASGGRFVCNVVMKSAGLPEQLGQEAFLLPENGQHDDPLHPCLHLQRHPLGPETLLVAEHLRPTEGPLRLREARDAVLSTLRFHFPFLDDHLLAVDSPNDGLPAYDHSSGSRQEVPRFELPESQSAAEPMESIWRAEPGGFLDVGAEPLRGPLGGSYLVGKTVLPGLGQEGELLAAWSAARLLTKKDAVRQRRRRQMWTKIETG